MTQPPYPPHPYAPYSGYSGPPSPYQPPSATTWADQFAFDPAGLLRPARRAAILLFVLGAMISLLGSCNIISSLMQSPNEIIENQRKLLGEQGAPPLPISAQAVQRIATAVAIVTLVLGLLMIALGEMVRRGNATAAGVSIAVAGIVLIGNLLVIVATLIMALAAPVIFVCACSGLVPAGLLILLIVWLIQAIRGMGLHRTALAQYQAQYWQYQQAQQAYGYGAAYGQPSAAPPELEARSPHSAQSPPPQPLQPPQDQPPTPQ